MFRGRLTVAELTERLTYREFTYWVEYLCQTGELKRSETAPNFDEMTDEELTVESQKQASMWFGCVGKPRIRK